MDFEKDNYKILVSGDSISKGVVLDEEKGKYTVLQDNYVSLIQSKLRGAVLNLSKFGATITKGVSKLNSAFTQLNPDLVLIEYGGNDCDFNWDEIALKPDNEHFPKTDVNVFEKLLKDTVCLLKSHKSIPVLTTLPPLDADRYFKWICKNNPIAERNIMNWLGSVTKIYWWQERYNSAIIKVAQETNTRWIDIRGAFLCHADFTKFICMDGIHPNREGHRIIAEKILDYTKTYYDYLLADNLVDAVTKG